AGQGARLPHGRHRRPAAVRHPRALSGGRRAPDRDPVRAGRRVSARPVDRARLDGPRLQVRFAGAAQGPRHRGGLHRHAGLPASRRRHSEAPRRGRRERGIAEAHPCADRPGHRRQVGARDRAGGHGRDPGGSGRRLRHTDECTPPAPGRIYRRPPSVRAGLADPAPMKAIAQRREAATLEGLVDRVLCHDVRDGAGKIAVEKGARLTPASAKTLLETPWEEIHLLVVELNDLHEEEAGKRLAAVVVGDGVEVKGYTGGQWTLAATRRGLLRVPRRALAAASAGKGIPLSALFARRPGGRGETIGKCRVTPPATPAETIAAVEKIARAASGLVAVHGFRPTTIGVVAQERLDAKQRARFEAALKQKVEWFGGRLLPIQYAGGSPVLVADTLTALRRDGAEVLVVAGASALDPLDPVFGGLTLLGARMERHGAPAHPGSLLWLAIWDGKAVLGMPTCGMFSQATTFDLALPQILAGERVDNRTL